MASRKEQKEQARAARLAQEQAAAASKQRMRRIQIFGGATAIAVIVIVVAIVVSSSGSSNSKNTTAGLATGAQKHQIVNSIDSLLSGIPQNGVTLGSPKAKVTMLYFGDLECPICKAFTLDVFPTFVQQEVKTDTVKVTYHSSCTATCNDYSNGQSIFKDQQVAAYAAGKQNKFWQYVELFYHQQGTEGSGYVTPGFIEGIARQIAGLNISKWQSDRKDSTLVTQVSTDQTLANQEAKAADEQGTSTPTLVMDGPKGSEVVPGTYEGYGFPSPSELEAAVKTVS